MIRIKFCGLSRPCDIEAANELHPDYIGFVFAEKSKRYVTPDEARDLKKLLAEGIPAVGVFVNAQPETVAGLLAEGTIDLAQLHGAEDAAYLQKLRKLTDCRIIQAYRIQSEADLITAEQSEADYVLLDSGAGTGKAFDWTMLRGFSRPYFLAGGLSPENAGRAVRTLRPYAVDVSSGIETDGVKDRIKMAAFAAAVRSQESVNE